MWLQLACQGCRLALRQKASGNTLPPSTENLQEALQNQL